MSKVTSNCSAPLKTTTGASAPYEEDYWLAPSQAQPTTTTTTTNNRSRESMNRSRTSVAGCLGGAAVAGAVVGTVLVGPVIGLVAAGGAVALAATNKGPAGNVTRATGGAVASVGTRLQKINQKHHITNKVAQGWVKTANWVAQKSHPSES